MMAGLSWIQVANVNWMVVTGNLTTSTILFGRSIDNFTFSVISIVVALPLFLGGCGWFMILLLALSTFIGEISNDFWEVFSQ